MMILPEGLMSMVFNNSKSINNTTLYKGRSLFLGRVVDWSLIGFGIALILTLIVRVLNIYNSPLSITIITQGFLGLILMYLGLIKQATLFMKTYKGSKKNIFKIIIAGFPFICFSLFILYRVNLEDLKVYLRLVEEGSLVEWLSFLFLLLSAFLLLITGKEEIKRLAGKFVLLVSGLTFILAMEEVSWGQMIFNWQSPEFFIESNAQQETNIHNMILLSGQPNTIIVTCILFILTFFCLIRWCLDKRNKIKSNSIADVIFPPILLVGYFLLGALIYLGLVLQINGIEIPVLIPSDQEIFECFFALGILLNSCRIYINWGD